LVRSPLHVALWPDDKWFKREDFEPTHMVESKGRGDLRNVKVLDTEVRRDIDLEFLEKAGEWMKDAKAQKRPFFMYFNHSNVHFPVVPRAEYQGSSNGGAVADCIQMVAS
jgi:arylsulfatase